MRANAVDFFWARPGPAQTRPTVPATRLRTADLRENIWNPRFEGRLSRELFRFDDSLSLFDSDQLVTGDLRMPLRRAVGPPDLQVRHRGGTQAEVQAAVINREVTGLCKH